jgi:acyl carrier protein phosphodiesterase
VNYLAHAYLSKGDPGLVVGNFIADHLKGQKLLLFPPSIIAGVKLHRKIDAFADSHPLFRQSKRFFYDGFEKYSGILVDIFYDHFLARDFRNITGENLKTFVERHYEIYQAYINEMPPGAKRFLDYAVKNNIFESYSDIVKVYTVLSHLSHRIGHSVQLQQSAVFFSRHERDLEGQFNRFFEEALAEFIKSPAQAHDRSGNVNGQSPE